MDADYETHLQNRCMQLSGLIGFLQASLENPYSDTAERNKRNKFASWYMDRFDDFDSVHEAWDHYRKLDTAVDRMIEQEVDS